jgi:dolichol-phosphate mannosyltransferase
MSIKTLSIIVPTFNERQNIGRLIEKIRSIKHQINCNFEIVFIDDDSPDGTWDEIKKNWSSDVRGLLRHARKGLASAVVEGMLTCNSKYFIIMDADMQHDETMIPSILRNLRSYDLVVVCRNLNEQIDGFSSTRRFISKFGNSILKRLMATQLSDPLSGFFGIRSEEFHLLSRKLNPIGFKILSEIIFVNPKLKVLELPGNFKKRLFGQSKLDTKVIIEMFEMVLHRIFGKFFPLKVLFFLIVGFFGMAVHLTSLFICIKIFNLNFSFSQAMSIFLAMTFNFFLNNILTYSALRIKGVRVLFGLLKFCLACLIGALINQFVSVTIFKSGISWWVAGLSGAAVGSLWNYVLTSSIVWSKK